LAQVQRQALRLDNPRDTLDRITRSLVQTLGLHAAAIALVEPGEQTLRVVSQAGTPARRREEPHPLPLEEGPGRGLMGAAAACGRPLLCNDVTKDARYLPAVPGTRSELVLPMHGSDGLRGVLSLQSNRKEAFQADEVELLAAFACQAAEILRTAEAYERERRRAAQVQILHRVHSSVARLGNLDEVVRVAADAIRQSVADSSVTIRLLDAGRRELVVRAYAGAGRLDEELRRVPLDRGAGVAAEVARTGVLRLIPDLRGVPEGRPSSPEMRCELDLPIVCGQGTVGVLTVEAPRPGAFSSPDVTTFQGVADILAVAVENARLFERVEREKQEWAGTFDAITDMVSIHDQEFRLLRGNRALLDRAGRPAYALSGQTCTELYQAIIGAPIDCPHVQAERDRRPVSGEFEAPGGGVFRLSALPCFRSGNLLFSVHLCEEITAERRLREQLLQSEKMAAVGQLVSGVAHELNNPLAGVMGYTQLMLTRPLDGKLRGELERVFSEAQRASKIVQNLLTFARKHKPERRYLGLNGIVEKTLELRSYELRVSSIEVETDFDPALPMTMLDFHQMQQVVLNIITNAEQAMLMARGRGRLVLRTRSRDGLIELSIQDDGPGIPAEHLSRVFDPFFTTKPVGQGTGLGLSICHGIVKEHGGRLRVDSRPGQGTTFTLELPVLGAAETQPRAAAAETAPVDTGRRSILVVDDEPAIQDLLVELLSREGHRVDTAGSGSSALGKILKGTYDLIISDMKMPGMSGAELYDRLSSERPEMARRVVFTSGEMVSSTTEAFLRRTGSRTLLKPFTIDELRGVIGRFFAAS
jgi:signal transduction histidine kinase/GAF domain-containing protein